MVIQTKVTELGSAVTETRIIVRARDTSTLIGTGSTSGTERMSALYYLVMFVVMTFLLIVVAGLIGTVGLGEQLVCMVVAGVLTFYIAWRRARA